MSNSTSSAFHSLPVETGKQGETISVPSIRDYLEEISKDDNVNVDEYLSNPENTKAIELRSKGLPWHPMSDALLNPKMTYTWKDRLYSVWIQFKNIEYSMYNILDFRTYREFEDYGCTYIKVSTPWKRFKFFVRIQYRELIFAWTYTPDHIIHFNKNKPRINWFENKLNKIFFLNWDDKKDETVKELKEQGYRVEDNRIWHEPIPLDEDKRIL